MKTHRTWGAVFVAVALLVAAGGGQEPNNETPKDVKAFMRMKLTHAQHVLEGLTLEDFTGIARHAEQMALLSEDASWNVIETREYYERSADFRRNLEDVKIAAQKKNLDGAALAYVGVTLKCVECHRYIRQVQHVDAPGK